VDCVKLAGNKAKTWFLRTRHPKVLGLKFKTKGEEGVKRQDRVNARVRYIEGDLTSHELPSFAAKFRGDVPPEPLTEVEKSEFCAANMSGLALASDAFFPFRDNIDHAARFGVR